MDYIYFDQGDYKKYFEQLTGDNAIGSQELVESVGIIRDNIATVTSQIT